MRGEIYIRERSQNCAMSEKKTSLEGGNSFEGDGILLSYQDLFISELRQRINDIKVWFSKVIKRCIWTWTAVWSLSARKQKKEPQ